MYRKAGHYIRAEAWLNKIKEAKTLKIEVPFYQQGRKLYEFNVASLFDNVNYDTPEVTAIQKFIADNPASDQLDESLHLIKTLAGLN